MTTQPTIWPWQAGAIHTTGPVHAEYESLTGDAPGGPVARYRTTRRFLSTDPAATALADQCAADTAASPRPARPLTIVVAPGQRPPGLAAAAGWRVLTGTAVLRSVRQTTAGDYTYITTDSLIAGGELDDLETPDIKNGVYIDVEQSATTGVGVHDDGERKWFRFRVFLPPGMEGDPAAGWTDAGGLVRVRVQHSQTLTEWAYNQVRRVAGADPEPLADGRESWLCESLVPYDWRAKLVDIVIEQRPALYMVDYQRDRDITGISIGTTAITLPAYPYSIPGDIAALVADLDTAGYPGCTVTYDATSWKLTIPDIVVTDYMLTSFAAIDPPQEWINALGEHVYFDGWYGRQENVRIGSDGSGGDYVQPKGQFFRAAVTIQ